MKCHFYAFFLFVGCWLLAVTPTTPSTNKFKDTTRFVGRCMYDGSCYKGYKGI